MGIHRDVYTLTVGMVILAGLIALELALANPVR